MSEEAMVLIALGFAAWVAMLGLWGLFAPGSIATFIRSWSSIGGMWLAIGMRLSFAVVLWFSAPLSRTESALQLLAGVIGASAVVLPLFGYTRFKGFIDWWAKLPPMAMRAWCLVAIALGGFTFWSVMRPIKFVIPANRIEYVFDAARGAFGDLHEPGPTSAFSPKLKPLGASANGPS